MRAEKTEQSLSADVLVIGGGINGTGVARDAAGRGLSVVLCEQDDLAQHTSSASTKLIHGGLRYLENYDFRLVRHALKEREVLLRSAPHIIWPLRFVLPHHKGLRPRWLIRLGLFLYDNLGGRKLLPKSIAVKLDKHPAGAALKADFVHAFVYSDCWVQDARLVVLNARDARTRGARVLTRTKCTGLQRNGAIWVARLEDGHNRNTRQVRARAIVNAAGPWVENVLSLDSSNKAPSRIRLVKGSHIVVRKCFEHSYPYIFQNSDGRVLFAIPFEQHYTLLGTTDIEVEQNPAEVCVEAEEIDYICDAVSHYLRERVTPKQVVWSYTGVRPLFNDEAEIASEVTRDYVLRLDATGPPIVSVFGGKITTHRRLSEEVMGLLSEPLGATDTGWTEHSVLPGGDLGAPTFTSFVETCRQKYPWLDDAVLNDYTRNYGSDIHQLLLDKATMADLGEAFGGGLFETEVAFLAQHEWAELADDILWRRTKKGLCVPAGAPARVQEWLQAHITDGMSQV